MTEDQGEDKDTEPEATGRGRSEQPARRSAKSATASPRTMPPGRGPQPDSANVSPSVEAVAGSLGEHRVSSAELVAALAARHPEVAQKNFDRLGASLPSSSERRTARAWIAAARSELAPNAGLLHTRLLVLALAHVDPVLGRAAEERGLVKAVAAEIKEPVDSLFRLQFDPMRLPDANRLHLDDPTGSDALGREVFARVLALRLLRVWRERVPQGAKSSFMVNVHGAWGAGKSSLLALLERALRAEGPDSAHARALTDRPVVIHFNAWEHQRLDPPWWPLMNTIVRSGASQLPAFRRHRVRLRERVWRWWFLGGASASAIALLLATALIYVWSTHGWSDVRETLRGTNGLVKQAAGIASAAGGIVSATIALAAWVRPFSIQAVQDFIRSSRDPMLEIRRHFAEQIERFGCPVVVLIDDVDRCKSAQTVQLLEGVQTLFGNPRVTYVIAADRRWLHAAFEDAYRPFADMVRDPGRSMGSLFLEKAFELAVGLPRLSAGTAGAYLRSLLSPISAGEPDDGANVDALLEHATTESSAIAAVRRAGADSPAARAALLTRLASKQIEEATQYFLEPFVGLMEPNPRAMKRLLNEYAIRRDLAILQSGLLTDEQRGQLVLCSIIALRWPLLEEYFQTGGSQGTLGKSEEVQSVLGGTEFDRVRRGEGVEVRLDDRAIALLLGGTSASG